MHTFIGYLGRYYSSKGLKIHDILERPYILSKLEAMTPCRYLNKDESRGTLKPINGNQLKYLEITDKRMVWILTYFYQFCAKNMVLEYWSKLKKILGPSDF